MRHAISGTVELPYQIQLAIRSVSESGRPYGRLITVRGLSQGTENVLAQSRDTYELALRNDSGIRIGKDVKMGARMSHTATYLQPTAIFQPRRAILGVRYNF